MSKAAERSSETKTAACPVAQMLRKLSVMRKSVVPVEWCLRYADWKGLKLGDDET